MVFHGFWLVSMVFQGGFMVFHGFWLWVALLVAGEGSDPRPKKPPAHAPAEHVQCMYIVHTLNTPTGGHGQWPVPAAREKQSGDILHILHILCAPKCT